MGSLILHYEDNSTLRIDYDSSMECEVINMKKKERMVRAVVSSAHFLLFNRKNLKGLQTTVSSTREREFSAEEVGFTKVRSIARRGCGSRQATVTIIAVSLTVVALFLVLAAILLYRWRKAQLDKLDNTAA